MSFKFSLILTAAASMVAAVSHAATIPTGSSADLVLGRPLFYAGWGDQPASVRAFDSPTCVTVDPVTRKVFVGDADFHRIMRFASVESLANGAPAEAVFGQPRFTSTTAGAGDYGLGEVNGLCMDSLGRLYVADTSNNRILIFEQAAIRGDQPYADYVIGQPDFSTKAPGTSSTGMNQPRGLFVDSFDRLWVADTGNNRVLKFTDISYQSSGAAAAGVFGQADFISSAAGTGSLGLAAPTGVTVSAGGSLYVACQGANRVMRFDKAHTLGNGSGANAVFGQPDFVPTAANLGPASLSQPSGVTLTADNILWVTDTANRRILRFDAADTRVSGASADGVVGQKGFFANGRANRDHGFYRPFGQSFIDSRGDLWVPDTELHRVTRFRADVTRPTLAITGKKLLNFKTKCLVEGNAYDQYQVQSVFYQLNSGPPVSAVRVGGNAKFNWSFRVSLKPGSNTIAVYAIDKMGNKSLVKIIKLDRPRKKKSVQLLTGN